METQFINKVNEVIGKESLMFCEMHNLTLLPVQDSNDLYVVGNNSNILDIKATLVDKLVEVQFKTVLVDQITPVGYSVLMNILSDVEFRSFVNEEEVYFEDDKIYLKKTLNIESDSDNLISINYLSALTNLVAVSKFLYNYIDEKFAEQLDIMSN